MNHMRFKVAVAAAFAAAIGVSSAAAAPYHGVKASLNYGTLIVKGTQGSDKIALRLKAGDSSMLEVDTGDEGSAEFSFPRADVARIVVDGGAGSDAIRIDESNGVFEDTISTTLAGGSGTTRSPQARERRCYWADPGMTRSTATAAPTRR